MPRLDFAERPQAFVVRIDLPGVRRQDVEVSVLEGNLEVRGCIPARSTEHEDVQVHRAERLSGPFRRVVPLPRQADGGSVSAAMSDGVLTITINKRTSDSGRVIPIE
jgi:HSP20 family protein